MLDYGKRRGIDLPEPTGRLPAEATEPEVLASFPMDRDGSRRLHLRLHRRGPDGRVSPGDSWTLSRDGWEPYSDAVIVYDLWADSAVGDSPIPLPSVAWLVLALVGVVFMWRR